MISVAEARALMLTHITPLGAEQAALADALGRTLAEPIIARRAQPPFRASAMDGYALRSADTPGALALAGQSIAGRGFDRALQPGECARIFTGAPIPDGADAILIQEDAGREGERIVAPLIAPGLHVREIGIDFPAGAALLQPPAKLNGAALALAAAAGRTELSVRMRPRVIALGGGDEIVPPGAAPGPAQIFESASYGVAGLATNWGAQARTAPPIADDAAALTRAMAAALEEADLLIVIGGASVGEHDHARSAAEALGARVLFEKVAVRPGKPTWFAPLGAKAILGLPGNPASAFVCARLFLLPMLEAMTGRDPAATWAPAPARLAGALKANGPRETYLRATSRRDENGQVWAEAAADQDSSLISVFAAADTLIIRPPHAPAAPAGALAPTLAI